MTNFTRALDEYRKIIGSTFVSTDKKVLSLKQTATFKTNHKIVGILKPATSQEVQSCLRIANKYKTPVYPVSTGLNWGYGSSVPSADNCILIDLSRMNRILDYSEKYAYVTVEPGVTFIQLYDFLNRNKSELMMSASGGSPYSSLIGITAERGIGKGIYGNRHEHICNLEIILPTGDCIHTGFGRFPSSQTKFLSREGVGPAFDDIFLQSNFGIITKMTIWLIPRPKYFQIFTFSVRNDLQLKLLVDAFRKLRLERIIESNFLIANEYRIIDGLQQYPWKETHGKTPLPYKNLKITKKKWKLSAKWYGSGALYATSKEIGKLQRKYMLKSLKNKLDSLYFIDEDVQEISRKLSKFNFSFINQSLKKLKDDLTCNTFLGVPSSQSLNSLYWRKKTKIPHNIDPDRDRCGLFWISPVIPFDGKHVSRVIKIIKKIMRDHGFEPNLGINCITEREIIIIGEILYDREVELQDEKAEECYKVILSKLINLGYIPYRLNINSMDLLPRPTDDYGKLLKILKQTLDPNDILAPNRYDFRSTWPTAK